MVPFVVRTHIYLGSLTFSLTPDEAASVGRQRKLVLNKCVNIALFKQEGINTTWIQN